MSTAWVGWESSNPDQNTTTQRRGGCPNPKRPRRCVRPTEQICHIIFSPGFASLSSYNFCYLIFTYLGLSSKWGVRLLMPRSQSFLLLSRHLVVSLSDPRWDLCTCLMLFGTPRCDCSTLQEAVGGTSVFRFHPCPNNEVLMHCVKNNQLSRNPLQLVLLLTIYNALTKVKTNQRLIKD